ESQNHIIDSTNLCRAFDNCVEDRLHVRRRTTNNAEHLRRCRLMLQGFTQLRVALLEFFKQPHVLNRDDSLGRKGFKEFNLLSGERTDLLSTDRNSSNRNPLAQQRCDKQCPRAGPLLACLGTTKLSFYLYREIVHMNCLPLNYSTTSWAVSVNRYVFVR